MYLHKHFVLILSIWANLVLSFRLPTTVYPTQYKLRLFVVLDPLEGYERFTATGGVFINVTCAEATNEIYLHSANLTISHPSVQVQTSTGTNLTVKRLSYELENDFFIITLDSALQEGEKYGVQMEFVAPIPDYRLNGMYQDYYEDPETLETKYVATTLFAPYHTRRLFPCFDEPSFRAEYSVELGHHSKYHAMANEELISTRPVENVPDYVWNVFKATPSISSYITAMIISDFTYEEAIQNSFQNRTVRIYATPHLVAKGAAQYAANITDAVMGFFESRFVIKYPLTKLFSIALPHFFFSAMENIGMITYKEPVLLYLRNETTEDERFNINSVMSHELAHQWFGNIVACKWWAYVYLKEGFSTFYSYYGMNHTNPELKPWEMFIPKVLNVAMQFDGGNATHPLENFPPTSAAVADIYTSIPYLKGASILRMTSSFLTEQVFEEGIKQYVNKYKYTSVVQNDLFDTLQEELDKSPVVAAYIPAPLREIMNSWSQQTKYPIIYASRENDSSQLQLTQEAYSEEEGYSSNTTWWVPINLLPRSKPDLPGSVPDTWIPQGVTSISIDVTPGETIIVNPDGIGYYRVRYDELLRAEILKRLEIDNNYFPPTGKSKLVDDYFQLALAGHLPFEEALDFTKYIHNEKSFSVWKTFQDRIDNLLTINDTTTVELLKSYTSSKITLAWDTFYSNETDNLSGATGMMYEQLIKSTCQAECCLPFVKEAIDNLKKNPKHQMLPKEIQSVVYCAAVKQDNETDTTFKFILEEYLSRTTLFGRKQRLLKALTCTANSDRLQWLVDGVFNDTANKDFPRHEKLQLLQVLVKKPLLAPIVLDRIDENLDAFFDRYKQQAESLLGDAFENAASNLTDLKVVRLLERMENLQPLRANRLRSKLNRMLKRKDLLNKSNMSIQKWLQMNVQNTDTGI